MFSLTPPLPLTLTFPALLISLINAMFEEGLSQVKDEQRMGQFQGCVRPGDQVKDKFGPKVGDKVIGGSRRAVIMIRSVEEKNC